jgi:hypothetical protein
MGKSELIRLYEKAEIYDFRSENFDEADLDALIGPQLPTA